MRTRQAQTLCCNRCGILSTNTVHANHMSVNVIKHFRFDVMRKACSTSLKLISHRETFRMAWPLYRKWSRAVGNQFLDALRRTLRPQAQTVESLTSSSWRRGYNTTALPRMPLDWRETCILRLLEVLEMIKSRRRATKCWWLSRQRTVTVHGSGR